ncbi:MAG: transcriptional regulator [Pasteurellales bacterium]|nr:MAG: transcriptional regulator [Pasteurellales bacterium]
MLQNTRLQNILTLVEELDYISVSDLVEKFNVSAVTIRKDLTFLEQQGYLYRNHGGASKKSSHTFERSIDTKKEINAQQKKAIAQKAVSFIEENDSIILTSGTTIYQMAKEMRNVKNLTVLTPSLPVAFELCKNNDINLIQLGGEVRKSSASVIGAFSESLLKEFSCNKLFLGIDGISIDFGISTSNIAEASLNKKMIEVAEQIYILGDSSKICKKGFGKICEINKIDCFITDKNIKDKQKQYLEAYGVNVIIADE